MTRFILATVIVILSASPFASAARFDIPFSSFRSGNIRLDIQKFKFSSVVQDGKTVTSGQAKFFIEDGESADYCNLSLVPQNRSPALGVGNINYRVAMLLGVARFQGVISCFFYNDGSSQLVDVQAIGVLGSTGSAAFGIEVLGPRGLLYKITNRSAKSLKMIIEK